MAKQLLNKKLVEVSGLRELKDNIEKVKVALADEDVVRMLTWAIQPAKERVISNAPIDTGRLRAAVIATQKTWQRRRRSKMPFVVLKVRYGKGVENANYAHIVEFGSSHQAAQPFFRPAIDTTKPEVAERVKEGITNMIQGALKK